MCVCEKKNCQRRGCGCCDGGCCRYIVVYTCIQCSGNSTRRYTSAIKPSAFPRSACGIVCPRVIQSGDKISWEREKKKEIKRRRRRWSRDAPLKSDAGARQRVNVVINNSNNNNKKKCRPKRNYIFSTEFPRRCLVRAAEVTMKCCVVIIIRVYIIKENEDVTPCNNQAIIALGTAIVAYTHIHIYRASRPPLTRMRILYYYYYYIMYLSIFIIIIVIIMFIIVPPPL